MERNSFSLRGRGFTLIELLIVVAIIAILAAIAVPNFLEAQTRSKVSRTLSDMRTIRTGLESYAVDNNKYPETDVAVGTPGNNVGTVINADPANPQATFFNPPQGRRSLFRVTTPISYLSSFPVSPWKEKYGVAPGSLKIAQVFKTYLYVRRLQTPANGEALAAGTVDTSADYAGDRRTYVEFGALRPPTEYTRGEWLLKSVGPDAVDNRESVANGGSGSTGARVYDSSNGTISAGDIVIFSDRSEP